MPYKIVTDSSCNLKPIKTDAFESVPMKIRTSQKEYVDDINLDVLGMVEDLKALKEKTGTSCPNVAEFLEAFGEGNDVLAFTISRNLSGSYQSAHIAQDEYEGNAYVFDTLSAGPGSGILVQKAEEFIAEEPEKPFEEMVAKMNEYMSHTHLIFALKSVQNLVNNGRVNPIVGKALGLLGIRIVGTANEEGKFQTLAKNKGKIKTLKSMLELMKSNGYKGGKVVVNHVNNEEDSISFKELIQKEFPQANVLISPCTGLCSYYAEEGGLMVAYEDL